MVLYDRVVEHVKMRHFERGYHQVKAPIILNEDLWHRSGHWTTSTTTCTSRKLMKR